MNAVDLITESFDESLPEPQEVPKFLAFPGTSVLTPQPTTTNSWDPRLILDLAIGIDGLEEILLRYSLTEEEFNILSETQPFRRELALTMRDVRENGVSFSQKAKIQAESYLEILDDLVFDNATPSTTRLEAIRSTVKWGRLEPPKETQDDAVNATNINVQINF